MAKNLKYKRFKIVNITYNISRVWLSKLLKKLSLS